ncbi:Phospholipase/carboxylesterase/thioesterase [Zopfochytrium polystomum]|nr:Phospholipase/carboxylesterase/thioesterase [Zopfochytrium polystomum]
MAPFAAAIAPALPHVRFVLPTAPAIPVGINEGAVMPAWFDIHAFGKYDEQGVLDSVDYVKSLIASEQATAGIRPDRIVLGGFSQGCVVALTASMRLESKLAGFIGLSGFMLPKAADEGETLLTSTANASTPFLVGHGDVDPMVKLSRAESAVARLRALGRNVEFKTYHGLGHSSCDQEALDVARFLMKVIPGDIPAAL